MERDAKIVQRLVVAGGVKSRPHEVEFVDTHERDPPRALRCGAIQQVRGEIAHRLG